MPLFTAPSKPNLGSTLLACIAFLALSSLWLLVAVRFSETGWDFTLFYSAAHLPIRSLYDSAEFVADGAAGAHRNQLLSAIGQAGFLRTGAQAAYIFFYRHAY